MISQPHEIQIAARCYARQKGAGTFVVALLKRAMSGMRTTYAPTAPVERLSVSGHKRPLRRGFVSEERRSKGATLGCA